MLDDHGEQVYAFHLHQEEFNEGCGGVSARHEFDAAVGRWDVVKCVKNSMSMTDFRDELARCIRGGG